VSNFGSVAIFMKMIEQFNPDPVELRYDAAGNLTFDGNFYYMYDAWGRQTKVKRAFVTKDATTGQTQYHEGSVVSTSYYDGQNRRIRKEITNSGDLDYTYNYYYDGHRQRDCLFPDGIPCRG